MIVGSWFLFGLLLLRRERLLLLFVSVAVGLGLLPALYLKMSLSPLIFLYGLRDIFLICFVLYAIS